MLGKDKSRKKDLLGLLFSSPPPLHPLQGNQDIGRLLLANFGESLWVVVRGQSVTGVNSTASLKKQEWDGDGYPLFLASTISCLLSPFCFFFSSCSAAADGRKGTTIIATDLMCKQPLQHACSRASMSLPIVQSVSMILLQMPDMLEWNFRIGFFLTIAASASLSLSLSLSPSLARSLG